MPTEPEHKSTPILAKIINLRKGDTYHSVGMYKTLHIYGKQDKAKTLYVC